MPGGEANILEIVGKVPVGEDVIEIVLGPVDGAILPRWPPGAHIDLLLTDEITRSYSLCGDPGDRRRWRLLVELRPGGRGSTRLRDHLVVGARLTYRGPYDRFRLAGASSYLFLGAGTGISPLLPMARTVSAARVYPWSFVYVGKNPTLWNEARALGAEATIGNSVSSVSSDFDPRRILADAPAGTAVHACGGGDFVDAIERVVSEHPGVELHRQRFTSADVPGGGGGGRAVELVLARRAERVRVPAGSTLLRALLDHGVDVPYACGSGLCGACVVRVLDGRVIHRDSVLTARERDGGSMATCVSVPDSETLVLDL
ncbi:flavin reductase family protein [Streptomyces pseudovenezuelae]|uniref:flavin reductase family protein n=1 Tax=Streptomyces pseudovenezuelae TaxID=67350 RepID=UPI00371F842B